MAAAMTGDRVDVLGLIVDYENGTLDEDETLELFQHLVATGLAWQLQGHYGRTAAALLQAGAIAPPPDDDDSDDDSAACRYVRDGVDTDGTVWHRCVTHDETAPSPDAPCAGSTEPAYSLGLVDDDEVQP